MGVPAWQMTSARSRVPPVSLKRPAPPLNFGCAAARAFRPTLLREAERGLGAARKLSDVNAAARKVMRAKEALKAQEAISAAGPD